MCLQWHIDRKIDLGKKIKVNKTNEKKYVVSHIWKTKSKAAAMMIGHMSDIYSTKLIAVAFFRPHRLLLLYIWNWNDLKENSDI